ncbi:hypothetical protein LTR36_006009 [Oleoguttula mirabilis]|uniref:Uncharacterized protein n=1 Tax=Oleoguttula mirabilis TaxID=1507867 RepID=A0AAV9JCY6_9PEZI|nr:hypothetical protein LTR36_006009 [Oleoguttula mirabilis]
MGFVLSVLQFVFEFVVIWTFILGGKIFLLIPRDGPMDHVDPFYARFMVRSEEGMEGDDVEGHRIAVKWWNRGSGEAYVCWATENGTVSDNCGKMHNLYLYCWDWSDTGVPGDIAKVGNNKVQTFTPNGTIHINTPKGAGPITGTWAAPITGDCRRWDDDWKWAKPEWEHSNVTTLAADFSEEEWMPPKAVIPNLGPSPNGRTFATRDAVDGDVLVSHFSKLPRRNAESALEAFSVDGAALVHQQMRYRDPLESEATSQIMHRAFSSLLEAQDTHNTLWKRITRRKAVSADALINAVHDAMLAGVHDEDKRKMETFALGAVVDAVFTRVHGGRAGQPDGEAMGWVWERIFGPELK